MARLSRTLYLSLVLASPTALAALGSDKLLDLPLEELLKVEVVSASRFSQTAEEAPASVAVIEENELRQHGYRNLADALVTLPGLYSSNDRNYTYLGVRGFNRPGDYGTRILLLSDGARRNDPLFDQALFGNEAPIELDWVKRLEFVAGPASAVYGSNALFGTVNAVMLEGRDINGTRVSLDAGTQNSRRIGMVSGKQLADDQDWFLGVAAYKSAGENLYFPEYNTGSSNGRANGLDGEEYHKAYAKFRWGNWRLIGNFSSRSKDLPTAPWGTAFGERGTWSRDDSSLLELRYEGTEQSGWQPYFRAYNGTYNYDGSYRYAANSNGRDYAAANWQGSEFHVTYTGLASHKLLLGIGTQWNSRVVQQYYESNPYSVLLNTNNPSHINSVFMQEEWRLHPQWLLNLSLRHDRHSDYNGLTSPRLALIWQPLPRLSLKAMTGQAYRYPNAYERYYNDGNVTQAANPNLRPERIRSDELAAAYNLGQSGRIGLRLYDNHIRDLIDSVTDSSGVSSYTNLSRVHARGVELEAENRWSNGYSLRGSLSRQRSKLDDGTTLNDSPEWLGKLIFGAPLTHGWTAAGEILGTSARSGNTGQAPGYGIINLKLQSSPHAKTGQISLAFYNLTDRRYYAPSYPFLTQQLIEQPRRQVMLRCTLAL